MGTREELVQLAFKKSVKHNIQLDTAEWIIEDTAEIYSSFRDDAKNIRNVKLANLAGSNMQRYRLDFNVVTDIMAAVIDIIKEGLS